MSDLSPSEIDFYFFTLILLKVDKLTGGVVRGLPEDVRYAVMKIIT